MRRAIATTACMFAVALALGSACGARTELDVPDRCFHRNLASAEITQLDAFIMLDSSGSMDFNVPGGTTRWSAMRNSLALFFSSPQSNGMGISLSFFPIIDPSVPEDCSDDAQCGAPGACQPRWVCLPSGGGQCATAADCEAAGFIGDTCDNTGSICDNRYTCDPGPYLSPVVPIDVLPDAAPQLVAALDARSRVGGTSTLPALTAIVEQARARAASHPDHKSIVILASDGLPTACDPALQSGDLHQAIENLADVARDAAATGIQVFVIGVAAPEMGTTRQDLDEIAAAGETESAFNITANADLSLELLEAFNQIRITAEACEFPVKIDETEVDLRDAEVVFEAGSDTHTANWRGSEAGCSSGGYYYDVDVTDGERPSRVTLCPSTCGLFGTTVRRTIELRTPCEMPDGSVMPR